MRRAMGKNGQTSLLVALMCTQNLPTKWPPTPLYVFKKSLRSLEEKAFSLQRGEAKKLERRKKIDDFVQVPDLISESRLR